MLVELIAEHLPLAAALRNTSIEAFGGPWRLEYLGDPLYRLNPRPGGANSDPQRRSARVAPDDSTRNWSVVAPVPESRPTDQSPSVVFQAALDAALWLTSSPRTSPTDPAVAATIATLADLNRDALDPRARRTYDSVLADLLFCDQAAGRAAVPDRGDPAGRALAPNSTAGSTRSEGGDFAWVLAGDDFDRSLAAWRRIIHSTALPDFRRQATARVAARANDPDRRIDWATALRAAIAQRPHPAASSYLEDELQRVEAAILLDQRVAAPGR